MRRVAFYGVGWLAAAAVAVLLAWQGVGRVGSSVTDRHPRALTADEARQALGGQAGPGDAPPGGGSPTTSPPPTSPATPPSSRPGATTAPSRGTTTTTARPGPGPTPPTTRPPTPTTATTTAGVIRTYNLVGGSATLRFDPSGKVTVVWADPNPGFRAGIDDRSDGGVRVRFDGDSHRSELEAWWDGGPQDRIEEDGGGGGGNSGPG